MWHGYNNLTYPGSTTNLTDPSEGSTTNLTDPAEGSTTENLLGLLLGDNRDHVHWLTGNVPWNQTPSSVIPPTPYIFLDWYNRKGCKCRRHEHTTTGDHWERRSRSQPNKALFLYGGGGGCNATRGLFFTGDYRLTLYPRILHLLWILGLLDFLIFFFLFVSDGLIVISNL